MAEIKPLSSGGVHFFDNIPVKLDVLQLASKIGIEPGRNGFDLFASLAGQALERGRPKALYRIAYIEGRATDTVLIDGVTFKSRILSVNLENAGRVFLYVVTCGAELQQWSEDLDEPLMSYFADYIKESVLYSSRRFLFSYLEGEYRLPRYSTMAPGSLKDWPIEQQKPLFRILGGSNDLIGVRLTGSCLMIPGKSLSGILFPSEQSFESCMLCKRENCPNRKTEYSPETFSSYGNGAGHSDETVYKGGGKG